MKKTLAILLTLALVICMIPGSAFAAAPTYSLASYATEVVFDGDVYDPGIKVVASDKSEVPAYTIVYKYTAPGAAAGTEGTIVENPKTGIKDAGTYTFTIISDVQEIAALTGKFVIKPYDLTANGISASVLNQTTALTSSNIEANLTFHDASGRAITDSALVTMLKTELTTTVGSAAGKTYPVTFALSKNLTGTIENIDFSVLEDIAGAKLVANERYGAKLVGTTGINGGAYDGTSETISNLFYLTDSKDNSLAKHYTVSATFEGKAVTTDKEAGTYYVTAKGIGSEYAGEKDITLTIDKRDASLAAGNVKIDAIKGQYSSDQFDTIVPTVRDNKLGVLSAGTDYNYTVTSGKVTIDFKGNFTGSQEVAFNVVPDDKDIAKIYTDLGITIDRVELAKYKMNTELYFDNTTQPVSVAASKLSSSYYSIEYRYTDAAGKIQVVSAPKDAATYTIWMVGENGYGGEAELATMQIKPFKKEWVEVTAAAGYTSVAPKVTVKSLNGGISFKEGYDFEILSNYMSTITGKGRVTISTKGNIEVGSLSAEYVLQTKSMSSCTAEFAVGSAQYYKYTGNIIKPTIKVRDGYTLLTQGTDYTITYKDAKGNTVVSPREAGTYTIEITGKGLYSGTKTMSFYIEGVDISYYNVTLNKTSAKATGSAQSVSVSSVKYGTKALSSTDYTVTYQNSLGQTVTSMKEPGTYKVVVTGKGGYSGSTYATFVITGEPQTVTLNKGESVKVYKDSDPIKVTAKATGDGTGFVYTSSNPEVATVNAYGVVTIKSIGRAKITATTVGMKKSEEASASFVVKVYPDKATISKKPWTEGKKGSLRVRWDIQEDATYYEVRYSRDKSFKKGTYKTKKVTASEKYDTQSTRLADLYSGKTYYVKVRAVKVVYNDLGKEIKYYGTWSGWRSAKTK